MKRESNEIKKENDRAASFMRFCEVVRHLRAEDGCPWDRAQTHTSLKPYCIEEAAEVIGGINIWEATGDAENLKEELGDLMLQILLHAQIAEEEGLFTIREVMDGASEKMIRRHPHVFGKSMLSEQGEPVTDWDAIKKQEKAGKEWTEAYLPGALEEAEKLLERASDKVKIILYTAKPGVVIGKGGAEIEKTKAQVQKLTDKKVFVDIKEVKRPDRDAQLVAENIAQQLENRISFRRAMKSAMGRTMKAGAKGIKASVSGRLGGADMARTEFYSEGTIPLQTLRADIDYGFAEANTTYGKTGVKVWIYKGEVLPAKGNKEGSDK